MRRRAQPWEARPPRAAPHAVRDTTTFGSHRQTRPRLSRLPWLLIVQVAGTASKGGLTKPPRSDGFATQTRRPLVRKSAPATRTEEIRTGWVALA